MLTAVQNQDLYIIRFPYDPEVVRLVKNVPGRIYVADKKYWTIPVDRLGFLMTQLKGTPYEHQLKVYSAENINENATLDSTDAIPDINLSNVPLYVEEGKHLFQHQLDFMKYAIDRQNKGLYSGFILADTMGLGKALSLDTKLYTPTGYKLMRDIQVGDYVFGKDGKPTKVVAVYNHHNVEMYRITFSDGVTIDCCKDHLWEIHDQYGTKVVPTSWFLQKDQFGKLRKDHLRTKTNYKYWISRCNPVEFAEQTIPLDPYFLGLLLGDGCIKYGVAIATVDSEVVEYIRSSLPSGYKLRQADDRCSYYISTGCAGKSNMYIDILRQLNLYGTDSHTKFVPEIYKYNSISIRTAVLQGLLDTDGYCAKCNLLQYTTVSAQLAEDVRFLVESLGGVVSQSQKSCGYCVEGKKRITGIAYTLTIRFDDPQNYVRLPRRKQMLTSRKFRPHRNIVSIEQIDNADAKCISVDNSEHLYLAEHFIVTHNTLEAMNLALYHRKFNKIKHCLIIACVNSAKYNWVCDIKKHTNGQEIPYLLGSRKRRGGKIILEGSSADKLKDLMCGHMYGDRNEDPLPFFLVMNIEAIRMINSRHYLIRERLVTLINKGYIGMVVCDEIHHGASPTSKAGKQLLQLKKDTADSKVLWLPMTGTPIVNKPTDVFLPLKLVDGHTFKNYYSWCQYFCVYGGFGNYQIIAYKNIPELKRMLQANMLRRLKQDVLDLPPKVRTIEYVENTSYQAKLYDQVVQDMIMHKDEIVSAVNPMVKFLKLRQVNGSPELVDTTLGISNAYLTKNAKMVRLLDLVDTILSNGEKVVIFSNWVESLRTIYKFLAKDHKVCCFTGTMKPEDREAQKQKFIEDSECKIMIGTVGALGTSHTLTVANNVIFYDLPWNPATIEQAEDRCHRAGTTSTVNVYYLISRDTVDEKVYDIIMQKDGVSKYIVDNELSIRDNPQLFEFLLGHNGGVKK